MNNKKSKLYSSENEQEVFENLGLYLQPFDYINIGTNMFDFIFFPIWESQTLYTNPINNPVIYMPFFIYLCDKTIPINFISHEDYVKGKHEYR